MNNIELERRLRSAAGMYERLAPVAAPILEQRILGRIAVTPRADRLGRHHPGPRSWTIQVLTAAALVAFAVAVVFLFREARLFREPQPVTTPSPSPQSLSSIGPGGWKYSAYGAAMNLGPMVTPTIGWNFGAGLTRTTDGGAHWTDVIPPGLGKNLQLEYLDVAHAWIIQDSGNQAVTFQTRDGGKTWQQGARVTGSTVDVYGIGGIQADFVDPRHGWLLVTFGAGDAKLYRTMDGGLHWQLEAVNSAAATPKPGQFGCNQFCLMEFASPSTGWITSIVEQAKPSLLMTHDGGVTWKLQSLPRTASPGCPCYVDKPVFADQHHGMVMLWSLGNSPVGHLLVTSDGGASWMPRPLPGEAQWLNVGFYDANHGWTIAGSSAFFAQAQQPSDLTPRAELPLPLYRTDDGGVTWVRVQTDLKLQSKEGSITGLQFVDQRVGFAVRSLLGAPGQGFQGSQLLKTTDGGRTWSVVFTNRSP